MRRPIASCACVLALITGAWVGQAYTPLGPPDPLGAVETSAQGATATAWRFYDAIDLLLRTGDDGALHEVIAPDFVDHVDTPTATSGRDRLVGFLASLRETHPAFRIVPEDVIAQGDRVVARLAPAGFTEGAVLGIPIAGASPWPPIDVVRVRGDRIVERWGDPAGYAPASTLYSESLTVTRGGDRIPVLQRITLAPGASDQTFTRKGAAILFLELGNLDIHIDDAIGLPTPAAGRSEDARTPEAGHAVTLGPGETLGVPDQVAFATANHSDGPAVVLLLTLELPTQGSVQSPYVVAALPDAGVTVQSLAEISVYLPGLDRVTAGLARVVLDPGARLAAHPVAGAEIVAVDAGTMTATIAGSEVAAWLQDPDGRSTPFGPYGQVEEGSSLSVSGKDSVTSYRNETSRPVTLLLLTLAPT